MEEQEQFLGTVEEMQKLMMLEGIMHLAIWP